MWIPEPPGADTKSNRTPRRQHEFGEPQADTVGALVHLAPHDGADPKLPPACFSVGPGEAQQFIDDRRVIAAMSDRRAILAVFADLADALAVQEYISQCRRGLAQ
jgi:hypothetical protein